MQVKEFIKLFGIEKLNSQPIKAHGKIYKMVIETDDIEYHSLTNWDNSKERLDRYHDEGSYRFYAINEQGNCTWVYGADELLMTDKVSTAIQENNQVLDFIKEYQSKNEYNPIFLDEYNAKFNAEFKYFLDNTKLSQETKDFYQS